MELNISGYIIVHLSQSANIKNINGLEGIEIVNMNLYDDYIALLKNNLNVVVFISATKLTSLVENTIMSIKLGFNHVPVIIHLTNYRLEAVRRCGEIGVDRIIESIERELVGSLNTVIKNQVVVRMNDFNIDMECYPALLRNALKVIETNHIKLMGTGELADMLNVSDCTLIREFKKYEILSPKRLLLFFKVKRALMLMMFNGLSLKDIGELSGFSNEKRFNECFHRIFSKPPGYVREKLTHEIIENFGKKHTIHEIS